MAFREHPVDFVLKVYTGVRKPKGYKKPPSQLKARRHGIATSGTVKEDMIWLRR